MSPFQQDVIKTTLDEFDVQAAKGLPSLRAQAIGAGAFGGGSVNKGAQRMYDLMKNLESKVV